MFAIGPKARCVLPRFTCASRIVRSSTHRPTDQLVQTSSSSSKEIEGQKANASALWATSETNRLIEHFAARIKAAGPISVADFMREALTNPRFGFYGRHEQFGRKEDLLVTPIIRQIYGEFLGQWVMKEHELVGTAQMQLVDMGPGRGTFVKHIAHLLKEHKYRPMHTFFALYEPNRLMRRRQAETLLGRSFDPLVANDYRLPESNYSLVWIDQLKQLLPGPTFFIVHEYLNAFPIHKFHKTKNGWKEVMIDWNPLNKQLQYVLAYKQTPMMRLYENFLNGIKNRQHVELSPQRAATIQSICKYIALNHGAALIADYAHWAEKSDTFRAFREENLVDPLSDPGNIDILSDVDFEELATRGDQIPHLQFFGPVSQGNFLYNIGLNDRLDELLRGKTPEEQEAILDDVEKLVSSEALGERVLYMCVQRATRNNAPAGFSSPH